MKKQYWLVKTEPSTFSIEDLITSVDQITSWEGVRNYQARNFLKNDMKVGDDVFFYHSNCPLPAIVGTAKIVKAGYPDPTAFDKASPYYDPKSQPTSPRWFMVDIKFQEKFSTPLSLTELKAQSDLEGLALLRKGNRLSVLPLSSAHWHTIMKMRHHG